MRRHLRLCISVVTGASIAQSTAGVSDARGRRDTRVLLRKARLTV